MEVRRGSTREDIISYLKNGGWSEADIAAAFNDVKKIKIHESIKRHHVIGNIVALLILVIVASVAYLYLIGGNETDTLITSIQKIPEIFR